MNATELTMKLGRKVYFPKKGSAVIVKIPASFGIIGDKVGIMTSREPFYGIMIESREIAETFNTCFELLWRNAR
ncbi:hypothetical protein HYY74_08095 [Candidatus Woesearchaeota archaeon]|nr:hypothetical protein [Candidatus Woesearchaeota archaeon]